MPKSSAVRTIAAGLAGFAVRWGVARAPSVPFEVGRARTPLTLDSSRSAGTGIAEGAAAGNSGNAAEAVVATAAAALACPTFTALGSPPRDKISAATRAAAAPMPATSGHLRLRKTGSGSNVRV